MAEFRAYPYFIKRAALKYLKGEHGKNEAQRLWYETLGHYARFVEEAPDLGGKENKMSSNLYAHRQRKWIRLLQKQP